MLARSCSEGSAIGCERLGDVYSDKDHGHYDAQKTREAHMKGCESGDGNATSCRKVGITPND